LTSGQLETAQQSLSKFSWRMTLQFLHHNVNNKKYNKQMSASAFSKCLSIPFRSKVISVKLKAKKLPEFKGKRQKSMIGPDKHLISKVDKGMTIFK